MKTLIPLILVLGGCGLANSPEQAKHVQVKQCKTTYTALEVVSHRQRHRHHDDHHDDHHYRGSIGTDICYVCRDGKCDWELQKDVYSF